MLDDWAMRQGGGRGGGIAALFTGPSGTGKTMSAEVIAGELGVDLYAVDLSTIVDKYIGETEKNLERVFTEAERVNGVLLFDEADACSASAPRSRTPTTGTPTSRWPTSCSGWRLSKAS